MGMWISYLVFVENKEDDIRIWATKGPSKNAKNVFAGRELIKLKCSLWMFLSFHRSSQKFSTINKKFIRYQVHHSWHGFRRGYTGFEKET